MPGRRAGSLFSPPSPTCLTNPYPPCCPCLLISADVGALLANKPRFAKLEFTADMLGDPRDLEELRRRWPRVTFKAVE